MTDEELNAKVAEAIGVDPRQFVEWGDEDQIPMVIFRPSTDHNHAAMAREWARSRGWRMDIMDKSLNPETGQKDTFSHFDVSFSRPQDYPLAESGGFIGHVDAKNEPRAICLAVLKIAEMEGK